MRAVVVLTAAVAAAPLAAADPAADAIADLGSPDWRLRERATRHLTALGDRAEPAVRAALATAADPEASARLAAVAARLASARLARPTAVDLRLAAATPGRALAELSRRSGYPIDRPAEPAGALRHPFDLTAVPFWRAVDEVCGVGGLTPAVGPDGRLAVTASDTFSPFVAYAGPFRAVVTGAHASRAVQLADLPRWRPAARPTEHLTVHLQVTAEPKAPLLGAGPPAVVRAVADGGASLAPAADPGRAASLYPPAYGDRSFALDVGVELGRRGPAGAARELVVRVPLAVLAAARPDVVIADLPAAVGTAVAGRVCDVRVVKVAVDPASGATAVDLRVSRRPAAADDGRWLAGLAQRLEAADAGGRRLAPTGVDYQVDGGDAAVGLAVTFAGRPARLAVVEWVAATVPAEFAFRGVPLP